MTAVLVVQDEVVSSSPGPREGGPRRRRAFTAREKLDHLTAYEAACAAGDGGGGGAYLREQGVYSSQITEWRKLRDAGVLAGKKPGEKIGRPSAEQAEIARLARELDLTRRRLAKTEAALDLVGKAHALLEEFSEGADTENGPRKR
jgi:transposase-like protein